MKMATDTIKLVCSATSEVEIPPICNTKTTHVHASEHFQCRKKNCLNISERRRHDKP